jgi:hypothetical protein
VGHFLEGGLVGEKAQKIYNAIVDGAEQGLTGRTLFRYVVSECPKATSKKIVRASLLALTDPEMKDAKVLNVIYALAIQYRLDPNSAADHDSEEDDDLPSLKKRTKVSKKKPADRQAT